MQRSLAPLTDGEFDLAIIGGGAFGAAAAHDAALRGLRTVLIERSDFGAGASSECFKMVHGGIRYLQHGDVRRLRASCAERTAFLHIAPHLVRPLPIAIPTYGRGRRGKALLRAGTFVYDWLTRDRNAGLADSTRQIHDCRFLSRGEMLRLFPDIEAQGLTGAAVFEDGQMYNPARLVLAFVKSAAAAGAVVSNYVEATDFVRDGAAVRGVRARDRIDGTPLEIRARLVLNAAGPWAEYLLEHSPHLRRPGERRGVYSRDAYLTVARAPTSKYALALQGHSRDRDARFSRSARHLFVVPWRDVTLLGVWHRVFRQHPDIARIGADEVHAWIEELNSIYPALRLSEHDISFGNCALVPFGEKALAGKEISFGKESRLTDHRLSHGVSGLVTLIGIRFTTARADAARALDLLLSQLPSTPVRAQTERVPLAGGAIEDFERFVGDAHRAYGAAIPAHTLDGLLRNYGTEFREVLARRTLVPVSGEDDTGIVAAQVLHAVRKEWAVRLEDVVLRRTDLGAGRHPGHRALEETSTQMSALLGWSELRRRAEIADCERFLQTHWAVAATPQPARAAS